MIATAAAAIAVAAIGFGFGARSSSKLHEPQWGLLEGAIDLWRLCVGFVSILASKGIIFPKVL